MGGGRGCGGDVVVVDVVTSLSGGGDPPMVGLAAACVPRRWRERPSRRSSRAERSGGRSK